MTDQGLRRVVSDGSSDVLSVCNEIKLTELEQAQCECCGLSEECTPGYVCYVKEYHCGKWLCGLCAEAVQEQLNGVPRKTIEEAVNSHMDFCKKYNKTIRINPKLSLAGAMREIVKRSSQSRNSETLSRSGIARSSSCMPRNDSGQKIDQSEQ